jgi:biopolymer transport protein ExbD
MSASVGDGNGQEVELNLAPIIDCFTVLITYLLVTASFLTLSALDVGVSATGVADAADVKGPPPMMMTLELKTTGEIAILVRGGKLKKDVAINVAGENGGHWDLTELDARLHQINQKWPSLTDVSVSAEPTVIYKDIVVVIKEIQETIPKVFISG